MNGVMVNFLDGEGVFGKFDGDDRRSRAAHGTGLNWKIMRERESECELMFDTFLFFTL